MIDFNFFSQGLWAPNYFLLNRYFWAPIMYSSCAMHWKRIERKKTQSPPLQSLSHSRRWDIQEISWKQLKTSLWKIRLATQHALSKHWQNPWTYWKNSRWYRRVPWKVIQPPTPHPTAFSKAISAMSPLYSLPVTA